MKNRQNIKLKNRKEADKMGMEKIDFPFEENDTVKAAYYNGRFYMLVEIEIEDEDRDEWNLVPLLDNESLADYSSIY